MNKEEIENILGNINFEVETEKEWVEPLGLDKDTWKQILNYITNLQQENKQLEDLLHKANDEVISYTNCCIALKGRIDKAIEYIKLWHYRNDFRVNSFTKGVREELLEILGDKE